MATHFNGKQLTLTPKATKMLPALRVALAGSVVALLASGFQVFVRPDSSYRVLAGAVALLALIAAWRVMTALNRLGPRRAAPAEPNADSDSDAETAAASPRYVRAQG